MISEKDIEDMAPGLPATPAKPPCTEQGAQK